MDSSSEHKELLIRCVSPGSYVGMGSCEPAPSPALGCNEQDNVRLGDDDANSRLERILGKEGLASLRNATVVVLGLGGVGSNCVEALARGGVGNFVLLDRDYVQASNINRQAIAAHSTLGQRKVDVARSMVLDINPQAHVDTYDMAILPGTCCDVIQTIMDRATENGHPVSYIVDAIDTVATKLVLARFAQDESIALISSMGAANKIDPQSLRIADLYKTEQCPLCRVMRKEGRKRGIKHLTVLYSGEHAVQVPSDPNATRSDRSNLGTMSYMPPIMGQMLAGYVIGKITDLEVARS